jgi:flagellar hook-length control protein FliK
VAAAAAEAMHAPTLAVAAPAAAAANNAPDTADAPSAEVPEPARATRVRNAGDATPVVAAREAGEARLQADGPETGKPRGEVRPSGAGAGRTAEGQNAGTSAAAVETRPGAPAGRSSDGEPAPGNDASPDRQSEGFRAPEPAAAVSTRDPHVPRFDPSPPIAAHQRFAHAGATGALTGWSALAGVSPPGSAPAPHPHGDPNVPLAGLAVEIAARAHDGKRRFEIRLDPPELGRIDVRLDVARDGQVTSRLVVERAETLDLLRRDAPALERALQSAGLRTGESGLEFSLRDHSGGQRHVPEPAPRLHILIVPDDDVAVREAVRRGYGILRGLGRGIDIRV